MERNFRVLITEAGYIEDVSAETEEQALEIVEAENPHAKVQILRNKWMFFKDGVFLFEIQEDPNQVIEVEGEPWILGEYLMTQIKSNADYDGIDLNVLYITDTYGREVK